MASDKPQYPGTNTDMKPGDVLYSKKSFSTFFVGHVAIVGPDYDIIHVHPKGPWFVEDTLHQQKPSTLRSKKLKPRISEVFYLSADLRSQ